MSIVDPGWPRAGVWLAAEAADPKLQVVGVPNSKSSLADSQAALAPLVVRDRLDRFSTYQGETNTDFGSLPAIDLGNWPVSEIDPVPLIGELSRRAKSLAECEMTVFLGGDNAITRPLVAAQAESLDKVGLITFDAHHDVRTLDSGPTNGNPIRGLIEEHGLPGANVVQIGIHSFANSAEYRAYADKAGVTSVTIDQIEQIGVTAAVDVALAQLSAFCEVIYVDVDVDVLDVAFAPGCPGSRPGGLTTRQLTAGVMRCAAHPTVRAMDIVEVDPGQDINNQTLDVMAHLLLSVAAGLAAR